MKRSLKYFIYFGIAGILIFNVCSVRLSTSKTVSNLNSIKTAFAQSECPDDERDVIEICVIPCGGGESATGDLIYCKEGCTDCTPQDCDADCGTEV